MLVVSRLAILIELIKAFITFTLLSSVYQSERVFPLQLLGFIQIWAELELSTSSQDWGLEQEILHIWLLPFGICELSWFRYVLKFKLEPPSKLMSSKLSILYSVLSS